MKFRNLIFTNTAILPLVFLTLFSAPAFADAGDSWLSVKSSEAYQQYLKGAKNELSKLICLMDMLKKSPLKVIGNGQQQDAASFFKDAKRNLADGYQGQKAADIINEYFNRGDNDEILYLENAAGSRMALRDFLLSELKTLADAEFEPR